MICIRANESGAVIVFNEEMMCQLLSHVKRNILTGITNGYFQAFYDSNHKFIYFYLLIEIFKLNLQLLNCITICACHCQVNCSQEYFKLDLSYFNY